MSLSINWYLFPYILQKAIYKICEAEQLRLYLQPIGFEYKSVSKMRRDVFQSMADEMTNHDLDCIAGNDSEGECETLRPFATGHFQTSARTHRM